MSKLGTVVKVQHTSNRAANVKLVRTRPSYLRVTQEYICGSVQVEGSLEVWEVQPSTDPKAQYETFVPVVE